MTAPLRRILTVTKWAALVVSNMNGTGIFATTRFLTGDLGRPLLVLDIWVGGGIVALAGQFSYAELGVNIPRAGVSVKRVTRERAGSGAIKNDGERSFVCFPSGTERRPGKQTQDDSVSSF